MKYDPRTGKASVFREPSVRANGLIFDSAGRLIAPERSNTGGWRRITISDRGGTVRTLADRYQGKRFNSPNDVAVDCQRRVFLLRSPFTPDQSLASSISRGCSGSARTAR